tara:strand:+ start:686 stop:1036 length:351 start_codon:yes stop_codon:yes gene_type:complete
MSVFVMINKYDAPIFEKGDIITYKANNDNFGGKVVGDERFHLIEVTGATVEEAEALVLPLARYKDNPDLQETLKPRLLTVDVDQLLNKKVVTKELFLSLLTRKQILIDIQSGEVVV